MENKNEKKAGALILSQIEMFNEATVLFTETVEPEICGCIDNIVQDFIEKNSQWSGKADFKENQTCFFALEDWNHNKDSDKLNYSDYYAYFELGIPENSDSNDSWTSIFCNKSTSGAEAGFILYFDHSKFGGKKELQNYLLKVDEKIINDLEVSGFKKIPNVSGNLRYYFLPFYFDSDALAAAYEDTNDLDYENTAFNPLRDALAKINESVSLYQEIISKSPLNKSLLVM